MKIVSVDCPFCNKEHELEFRREKREALVQNKPTRFIGEYYYCPKEVEYFETKGMLKRNLSEAQKQYKKWDGWS